MCLNDALGAQIGFGFIHLELRNVLSGLKKSTLGIHIYVVLKRGS